MADKKEKKPFKYSAAQIASLKAERETYRRQGKDSRVKDVDVELKRNGIGADKGAPPAGASTGAASSDAAATTPTTTR